MAYSKVLALAYTTQVIEIKQYGTDGKVTNFTVVNHHDYKDGSDYKRTTCYSDWTAFGRHAEKLKGVPVGSLLLLEGRLENEKWTDKFDQKRLKTKMIVQTVKIVRKAEKKPAKAIESEATS